YYHQNRPHCALRTRHWPIPQRHCGLRRRDGRSQHQTRRVPRRVELHHLTRSASPKSRAYLVTGPKLHPGDGSPRLRNQNGLTKGDWFEALLFAVAVAVGLTPEMLPMIVTFNLANGAMAM